MKHPALVAGFFALGICLSTLAQAHSGAAQQQAVLMALGWQLADDEKLAGATLSKGELTNFLDGFSLGAQDHHLSLSICGRFPRT